MFVLTSGLWAFAGVAALSILDKRQWKALQKNGTRFGRQTYAMTGWLLLMGSLVLAFVQPGYTAWMSVVAFGGSLTLAALCYALVAAIDRQFAIRLAQIAWAAGTLLAVFRASVA